MRLLAGAGAALAVVVAGLVLVAPAVSAHDALASSDPAAGSVVAQAPTVITLVFTADLLGDGTGAQLEVTGPSGEALADGAPVVEGTTVRQSLLPDAAGGAYRVLWRVVSSDGHPISGEFSFMVDAPVTTQAATPAPTPSTTPPTSSPTDAPVPATPLGQDGGASGGLAGVLTTVAVVAGVAAVAVVVWAVLRRGPGRRGR